MLTINGKEYDFNTEVKENIELTAQWTPKTYTVTFVDQDGAPVPGCTERIHRPKGAEWNDNIV